MKNKKILYLVNARIPTEKAHGIQIMNMCNAFAENGADITLIVPDKKNDLQTDPFDYYGIEKNFLIEKSFCIEWGGSGRHNSKIVFWNQLISFYLVYFFKLIFRKKDFIIYTRDYISLIFALFKFPIVYECHYIPKKYRKLFFGLAKKAKNLILISEGLNSEFVENDIRDNILILPDGVDLNKFDIQLGKIEARNKLGLDLEQKIVLYSGHLYGWKGVQTLADAVDYLSDGIITYFVGGTNTDIENFKNKNQKLIKENKIKVEGHKKPDEIPVWLKAADILVLPNTAKEKISNSYTSPLKLFEYMASSRPIIAADIPSLRMILDNSNCLFFKPDDPIDLAIQIRKLLSDKKLIQDISSGALLKAKNYSWHKRAEKIFDLINY